MSWWQRRLLELDTHAVDRRAENVLRVSRISEFSVQGIFQLNHPHACLDLGDRCLLGSQIQIISSLLFGSGLSYAHGSTHIRAVTIYDWMKVDHHQITFL